MSEAGRTRRPGLAERRERLAEGRDRRAGIDDPEVVLGVALRFLETRPRSVAEVRRRLSGAGYRGDLVEGALARLLELDMLDDAAFARIWIESRDRTRPRGEPALRQELRLKGIDASTVDAALAERRAAAGDRAGGPDDLVAERLLDRHARALGRIADPRARRQRAYALLARHGVDPETASRMSARFMSEASTDPGS